MRVILREHGREDLHGEDTEDGDDRPMGQHRTRRRRTREIHNAPQLELSPGSLTARLDATADMLPASRCTVFVGPIPPPVRVPSATPVKAFP